MQPFQVKLWYGVGRGRRLILSWGITKLRMQRTQSCELQADRISAQAAIVGKAIKKLIATNARVAQNQADYQQRFDKLSAEHTHLLQQHSTIMI